MRSHEDFLLLASMIWLHAQVYTGYMLLEMNEFIMRNLLIVPPVTYP